MELASNMTSSSDKTDTATLTSLACACLTSLVVARGDTGKYMTALTSLLMSPSSLSDQPVKVGEHNLPVWRYFVTLQNHRLILNILNFLIYNEGSTLHLDRSFVYTSSVDVRVLTVLMWLQVPQILTSLQKSVHAVLLGKTMLPDWLNSGVKVDAKCLSIDLSKPHRGSFCVSCCHVQYIYSSYILP